MLKKAVCLLAAVSVLLTAAGCSTETRTQFKDILKDIVMALPGGLKDAKDKIVDPAWEAAKEDGKEIMDAAKESWEESFAKGE